MLAPLCGLFLGRRPYAEVLLLQQRCATLRKQGLIGDLALFLEHPPTITLGRGGKLAHLLAPAERLSALGIEVHQINRGGDITLHAPGQLVCYPIVELVGQRRDVRRYVQALTEVMNQVARASGIGAGSVCNCIGLWVDREQPGQWPGEQDARSRAKLGAIGVAISRWVTSHGFALNLSTDLRLFDLIVPCGIADHPVTSIEALVESSPTLNEAAKLAHAALAQQLGLTAPALVDVRDLDLTRLLSNDDAALAARLLAFHEDSSAFLATRKYISAPL